MSRQAVTDQLKTLLSGAYPTYVYPDDFSTIPKVVKDAFVVIEELPGIENPELAVGQGCYLERWDVAVYAFAVAGEFPAPSDEDAAAKAVSYQMRDDIRTLIRSDLLLGGTIKAMGEDPNRFFHIVTPMQWFQQPAYGVYFQLPVISEA